MIDPHRRYRDKDNGSWIGTCVIQVASIPWWVRLLRFFRWWR